jgi:hypothetical protein
MESAVRRRDRIGLGLAAIEEQVSRRYTRRIREKFSVSRYSKVGTQRRACAPFG